MLSNELNPYEPPAPVVVQEPAPVSRRPLAGTVLLVLWLIEGVAKAIFLVVVLVGGFRPLESLAAEYSQSNRVSFFAMTWFMTVETVGPWIGVYYLTGSRVRRRGFDQALIQTLYVAGSAAFVATVILVGYLELVSASN